MTNRKLTAIALLLAAALPLTQTASAHEWGDGDNRGYARPAPASHRDDGRRGDRADHRDWRHDRDRYHRDSGYYPRRDRDGRRVTVVLPAPRLLLPPPVLLVPKPHKGQIVLRPVF
jgi:hypothetical protein